MRHETVPSPASAFTARLLSVRRCHHASAAQFIGRAAGQQSGCPKVTSASVAIDLAGVQSGLSSPTCPVRVPNRSSIYSSCPALTTVKARPGNEIRNIRWMTLIAHQNVLCGSLGRNHGGPCARAFPPVTRTTVTAWAVRRRSPRRRRRDRAPRRRPGRRRARRSPRASRYARKAPGRPCPPRSSPIA